MKKYKNILFDMDGVLINSMHYHIKAWQIAFQKNNLKSTQKKIKSMAGMTSKDTIEIIAKENNITLNKTQIQKIKQEKAKQINQIFKVKLFPQIKKNLQKLKTQGYTMAIVSGATKILVNQTLETLPEIFDQIISAEDVMKGKPNPDPYLKAIKKLNLKKSETLIIEDAPSGIQSANTAKIDVYAIQTTFEKQELKNATKIFKNHKELFEEILN